MLVARVCVWHHRPGQLKMVFDRKGKARGYAFAEFEHERDMLCMHACVRAYLTLTLPAAYKRMDGHKVDGRRVVVDVERARTVKEWLPRRLGLLCCTALCVGLTWSGGGLGGSRIGGKGQNVTVSGRWDADRDRDRYVCMMLGYRASWLPVIVIVTAATVTVTVTAAIVTVIVSVTATVTGLTEVIAGG